MFLIHSLEGAFVELYIVIYLAMINIITFFVYGVDKQKARKHQFRISERTLFLWAFIGGSFGAFFAMRFFHHKTKHPKFQIGIPLIFVMHVMIYILVR